MAIQRGRAGCGCPTARIWAFRYTDLGCCRSRSKSSHPKHTFHHNTTTQQQNDDVVRRNFRALLLVHILTAHNLPAESGGFLERALSGGKCDPYVVSAVSNSFGADVAITRPKAADSDPKFYERFYLYVEDPRADEVALDLTVKDKNLLRGDDVIGTCRLPLSELRAPDGGGDEQEEEGRAFLPVLEWSGSLDIVVRVVCDGGDALGRGRDDRRGRWIGHLTCFCVH